MLADGEKGAILQKDKKNYAIVPHTPLGVVTPDLLRRIADLADKHHAQALKITSALRIAMVGIKEEDIDSIWQALGIPPGAAVGACVRSVKACPGSTFCRLGQQDSLGLGFELDRRYHGHPLPAKLKIAVSGCPNQCAENCIKDLGFFGKKNGWTLTAGGHGGARPRLAEVVLEDLSSERALAAAAKIVDYYVQHAKKSDRLGRIIDRQGIDHLRQALLA